MEIKVILIDQDDEMVLGRDQAGQAVLTRIMERMGIQIRDEVKGCQVDMKGNSATIYLLFKQRSEH